MLSILAMRITTGVVSLCVIAALMAAPGCGDSDADSASTDKEDSVDPRFASADALIEYYNDLSTSDPVQA